MNSEILLESLNSILISTNRDAGKRVFVIFVDTSVWISFFRGSDTKLTEVLDDLINQDNAALALPVKIELLTGCRKNELATMQRVLSSLQTFEPVSSSWLLVESMALDAAKLGFRFGFADLLIAAISHENNGKLWSLDSDFKRMNKCLGYPALF